MDNIIFKRNYMGEDYDLSKNSRTDEHEPFISESAFECIQFQVEVLKRLPKIIIQKDKETFERIVPKLNNFTKAHRGIIEATIDYNQYCSYIIMLLPFMELDSKDDLTLFTDIAQNCHNLLFSVTDEGLLRVYILINYFDEIEVEDKELAKIILEVAQEMGLDYNTDIDIVD